jgi:hypothetical protein
MSSLNIIPDSPVNPLGMSNSRIANALNNNIVMKSAFRSMNGIFNYCHVNAQSLNAHFDLIQNTFDNLPLHLIAVSETWFSESNAPKAIPGYKLFHKDRRSTDKLWGGGVAIYLSDSIKTGRIFKSRISDLTDFLFVEIFGVNGNKMIVGVVYNPPRTNWTSQL